MITHDSAFEALATAPIKQTDVVVARQIFDVYGFMDDTLKWTSSDSLMSVKIDAVGEMLGTATKKAVVNLLGIVSTVAVKDIFQIRLGIYSNDPSVTGFNYISEGFYIVDNIDYDYDSGSTTVTMYDAMWKAGHTLYSDAVVGSALTYPVTVNDFAEYLCTLLHVNLDPNFSSLPNASFSIAEDLYTPINGSTIQNAIQDIAGATGTTARMSDMTLVFDQYNVETENLNSNSLKTLKIGNTYGPVTSVVLGRVPQNDNIAIYAVSPFTSTITSINTTTDVLTITGHTMTDGNMVQINSTGTMPAPLVSGTEYFVASATTDTFKLAPTYADAIAGTNLINLTSAGTGTISIPDVVSKEIQINNNQIVDKNRQDALPSIYNKLAGIYWSDVKSDTVGLGWHEVGDVIQFTQGSTTVRAFLTEVHLTLAGSIKENLVSKIPDVAAINYQTAGGILKSIYNTEIEVDKQNNVITSVVSRQDTVDDQINEQFTQITQDIDDILFTVQKAGGGNLLLNSVGYAKEQTPDDDGVNYAKLLYWDYPPAYAIADNGTITSYDSSESQNYGGVSGRVIQLSSDYLASKSVYMTQRVNVAVNTSLSFGLRVRTLLAKGDATITLSNDTDLFTINITDAADHIWEEFKIENFVSTMSWLDIKIEASAEQFMFSDLRILYGSTLQGWVQSNAEILSANVQFTKDGMRIFDSEHETETQVTYNEFSTRRRSDGAILFEADDTGVVTNDLGIKGSTSYIASGTPVIKQITIPLSNARSGIAFIRVS